MRVKKVVSRRFYRGFYSWGLRFPLLLHKVGLPKRRGKWWGIEKAEKLKIKEESTYILSALCEAFCNPAIAIHFPKIMGCNREFMTLLRQQKLKYFLLYNTIFYTKSSEIVFALQFWPRTRIARGQCISKITRGTLDQSAERLDSNNTPYMSTEVLCVELAFHRG